jgi:hypothetical protein
MSTTSSKKRARADGEGEAGSFGFSINDVLPPASELVFSVEVTNPALLKQMAAAFAPRFPTMVLWLRDTRAMCAAAHAADPTAACEPWTGIAFDSLDSSHIVYGAGRLPLAADAVRIFDTHKATGKVKDEVCFAVNAAYFMEVLRSLKDFKMVYMYMERGSATLTVYEVSTAMASRTFKVGLVDMTPEPEHLVFNAMLTRYTIFVPAGILTEHVRTLSRFKHDVLTLQLKERGTEGMTLVMLPEAVASVHHTRYVPVLKHEDVVKCVQDKDASARLEEARALFAATDPSLPPDARRSACGLPAAEAAYRAALFSIYDTIKLPPGFVAPARAAGADAPLAQCEAEVRALLDALHTFRATQDQAAPATFESGLRGSTNMEVIDTYCESVRDAPLTSKGIDALPCVLTMEFNTKIMSECLAAAGTTTVELAFPVEKTDPLVIKYDLGNTNEDTYVAFVIGQRIREM